MKQVRVIWGAALAERQQAGRVWVLWALLALLIVGLPLGFAGLTVSMANGRATWPVILGAGRAGLGVGLFLLSLAGWVGFVVNAMRQNHPSHARLVPGHVRSLRRALLGGGLLALLATVVPTTLAVLLLPGLPDDSRLRIAALIAAAAAAWPVFIALVMRWPQLNLLWIGGPLLLAQAGSLPAGVMEALAAGFVAGGALLWWATAAAAWGVAGALVRAVVLSGGPGHRRIHARVPRLSQTAITDMPADAAWAQWGLSHKGLIHVLTGRWLFSRRLQAGLATTARPSVALALAPELQPLGMLASRLPGLMLTALVALAVGLVDPSVPWRQALAPAVLGFCVAQSLAALQFLRMRQAVLAGRVDQALLRLLPGAPQTAGLNHWLARQLAASALTVVAAHGLVSLAALAWLGEAWGGWWMMTAMSALLVSLCAVPALWQDWARTKPAVRSQAAQPGRLLWALVGALGLNLALYALRPEALHAWWLLQALAAAGWAVWQWRHLAHWPCAWPVGHAHGRGAGGRVA
jgi:hypothetical protein